MKPFQAVPLLEDGAARHYDFGPEELAVICASHGGTETHLQVVRRMLDRLGLGPGDLHCGPHPPFDSDAAFMLRCAGKPPERLHNNCSGKHAGMLALALHHGWDTEGYWRLDHPVQQRIRASMTQWLDEEPDEHEWALDGCGVPTPLLPLREMARAYSRLVRRARSEDGPARAVVRAMTARPDLTSSVGRTPLVLMEGTKSRLLAKEGAEGVLCVAAVAEDWGLAVKVEDGSIRAVGPATLAVLETAGLLNASEVERLEELRRVPILNTLGVEVGAVQAQVLEGSESLEAESGT